MKKVFIICSVIVLCILFTLPVFAENSLTYNFDDIQVEYAAEFTALPVSVESNQWFTDIAGGPDKPLKILYGVVEIKTVGSDNGIKEEFIKISGEKGSERFLGNSMTTGWYDEGEYSKLKYYKTFFWSAKKLDGNTVVKDFNLPIKSVALKNNFDKNKKLTSIKLYFSSDGLKANNEFFSDPDPEINVYQADLITLKNNGDLTIENQ